LFPFYRTTWRDPPPRPTYIERSGTLSIEPLAACAKRTGTRAGFPRRRCAASESDQKKSRLRPTGFFLKIPGCGSRFSWRDPLLGDALAKGL
jgi:hypothetical protein